MDDLISRQAAIDALDEIRHALWEIDIPSPTVPEYVEHHEQVQSVWKLLDKKQKELYVLQSVQPEPCEDAVSRKKAFEYFTQLWDIIGTIMDRDEWEDVCMTTANELPSVTPKQRTGKWIHISEETWKCDQCGEISCCSPKYCPDCGSRNEVTT